MGLYISTSIEGGIMMGRRQKLKTGKEFDLISKWKHFVYWKPGLRKFIKRRLNKRYRRENKIFEDYE